MQNGVAKFGTTFTKHMLTIQFDSDKGGWQEPQIGLLENLSIHPAAKVLHYACETFEGMKAYKGEDGQIRLFRPLLNLNRLNRSNEKACLPQIDVQLLLKYIAKLVYTDRSYLPSIKDGGFYIRPTVISTDAGLCVDAGKTALLYVILSPVGPYFGSDFQAIRVAAVSNYVRAWPGGTGDLKLGGNYSLVIYVTEQIKKQGCKTTLWLFGEDEKITEAGVMNFFMFFINDEGEKELRTPPLDTTILPGITRRSLLELSREWGEFKVSEDPITFKELRHLLDNNRVLELMGAGTACVVCPISEILYKDELFKVPTMQQKNPLYRRFYQSLNDIQYGRIAHPWSYAIDPKQF